MSPITFYLIGLSIAFVWYTHDYYIFNLRLGRDMRYFLTDPKDIRNLFFFSLGSWVAVIWLFLTNDWDE